MLLKNMDHILAIYQEGSFSKAASRLYISQPALSNAVKKVEGELGLQLFDRSTNPIRPTPAGEYYIQCIRRYKALEEEMDSRFEEFRHNRKKTFRLGSSTFFCAYLLPRLTREFEKENRGCHILLSEDTASGLHTSLNEGRLDMTMNTEVWKDGGLTSVFLCREYILLAVPASFSVNEKLKDYRLTFEQVQSGLYLEPETPAVDLWHFKNEPFLLLKEGNDSLGRVYRMCRAAGFVPKAEMSLDQLYTCYCIAAEGRGIAFIRAGITHAVSPTDSLYFYKINDDNARRDVFLHCRSAAITDETMQGFIRFMKQNAPGPLR